LGPHAREKLVERSKSPMIRPALGLAVVAAIVLATISVVAWRNHQAIAASGDAGYLAGEKAGTERTPAPEAALRGGMGARLTQDAADRFYDAFGGRFFVGTASLESR
jgi:hypothetical protein